MNKKTDRELSQQISQLQDQKNQMRSQLKDNNLETYQDILYDLEKKKEREIRARIEKEQIQQVLANVDPTKLSVLQQDKKRELEKLLAQREALRIKEQEMIKEMEEFEEH